MEDNNNKRSTIDDKIQELIEWNSKFPMAGPVSGKIPEEVLKKYAKSEEEYENLLAEYEKMQKNMEYVKARNSQGKLTEEQIHKCKEGDVGGPFGYSTKVEKAAERLGYTPENYENNPGAIEYLVTNIDTLSRKFGSFGKFVDLCRNGDEEALEWGSDFQVIMDTVDIDLSHPNSNNYGALAKAIYGIRHFRGEGEKADNVAVFSGKGVDKALDTLTPRERAILSERFGLEDGHKRSLEEVGMRHNATRERVRQVEAKAMRKLRHPSRSKYVCLYGINELKENESLTEEQKAKISAFEDSIYESDIIFASSGKGKQDMPDERFLQGAGVIRELMKREIAEKEQKNPQLYCRPVLEEKSDKKDALIEEADKLTELEGLVKQQEKGQKEQEDINPIGG